MSYVKLQDIKLIHRNLFHFYTITMKLGQKEKFGHNPIYHHIKKDKMPRNKLTQASDSKKSACNVRDPGSIPGLGRSPGERNGNPLQDSCLENSMDRGAWGTTDYP